MKKIFASIVAMSFMPIMLISLSLPHAAFADQGKLEGVTKTATAVISTWTLLAGSTLKFSEADILERSATYKILVCSDGNTQNSNGYYWTILVGERNKDLAYQGTIGTYVKTTATGISATVELKTKRPASYWPWR